MIVLPAIDMIDGKPVRLFQGDYGKKEIVADSILSAAQHFKEQGASYIHMVDLDGAKSGKRENADAVLAVKEKTDLKIEIGGGIRTMEDISFYLEHGIDRVILGTAAIQNENLLKEAVNKYGERIAVGMDCRNGYAMAEGWLQKSSLWYLDFAGKLEKEGVQNIIFTDISKDGTMQGPNLDMLKKLSEHVSVRITASGGVHNLKDIENLSSLHLYGAIVGKAAYSDTFDLHQAIVMGEETC